MIYIPLGTTCSIAYNLKKYNLRKATYPFDWIRINNLNNVSKLLNNNFDNFLNFDKFKFKKISNKFMVNNNMESYIYSNDYCTFFHEFNSHKIDNQDFINKYKRRINRLYELLRLHNQITFIREEFGQIKINKIKCFIDALKKINNNMKYQIIIITNDLNYRELKINNVTFYYSNKKIQEWQRPELDWKEIFNI